MENGRKDSKQSKVTKKNANEKPHKVISPGDLFGKKPVMRVEETKASRKLQKVVNILYEKKEKVLRKIL